VSDGIFSSTATQAQLDKLQDLPKEQGGIGVIAANGDVGVEGAVNKQLPKGWFVEGEGSWMTRSGYRLAAWLGWNGRRS
jgi:hypothetical protein